MRQLPKEIILSHRLLQLVKLNDHLHDCDGLAGRRVYPPTSVAFIAGLRNNIRWVYII